jgi:hypothetical protein
MTDASGSEGSTTTASSPATAVPSAVEAGWTMAVLFGHLQETTSATGHLPSESEMAAANRIQVELTRLACLLRGIGKRYPNSDPLPDCTPLTDAAKNSKDALNTALATFHVSLTAALACLGREVQVGYQLGRSLRDTVNPVTTDPPLAKDLTVPFSREKVTTIQSWLRALAPDLPKDSAKIVSSSLGKWEVFIRAALATPLAAQAAQDQMSQLLRCLSSQGDVWISILTGARSTDGLLTPEGYVWAAEAAVSRAARIVGKVLRHYWPALLALAAVLAAVLALSAAYLPGGTERTWTQMVSIVGSLGVTARGIGSTLGKLSREGAQPVYAIEEEEAKAWAITALPMLRFGSYRALQLRRAGIGPSRSLGRA